jgi:hypothetical protein
MSSGFKVSFVAGMVAAASMDMLWTVSILNSALRAAIGELEYPSSIPSLIKSVIGLVEGKCGGRSLEIFAKAPKGEIKDNADEVIDFLYFVIKVEGGPRCERRFGSEAVSLVMSSLKILLMFC